LRLEVYVLQATGAAQIGSYGIKDWALKLVGDPIGGEFVGNRNPESNVVKIHTPGCFQPSVKTLKGDFALDYFQDVVPDLLWRRGITGRHVEKLSTDVEISIRSSKRPLQKRSDKLFAQ
jgi:hypothetical protein